MNSQMASQIVSGSDGDIADTEPIYCVKDVLDELEKKVLLKYKDELEEIEAEVPMKLKAGLHNRQIMMAFMQSLGETITTGEENEMTFAGNIDKMTEAINNIRDKYLKPPAQGIKGISVNRLDNLKVKRKETYDWSEIPLNDCILTQISEDGNVTSFSVRPELMKIAMYREEGKDMTFVNKVIRNVNYLNRIFFKND